MCECLHERLNVYCKVLRIEAQYKRSPFTTLYHYHSLPLSPKSSLAALCRPLQSKQSSSLSDRDTGEEDSDLGALDDCGGFWQVQRRLQEEAQVALALARPMARMQVEVERQIQQHRRSPVADLVGQYLLKLEQTTKHECSCEDICVRCGLGRM